MKENPKTQKDHKTYKAKNDNEISTAHKDSHHAPFFMIYLIHVAENCWGGDSLLELLAS